MSVVIAVVIAVVSAVSFAGAVVVTDMCAPRCARASCNISHYAAEISEVSAVLEVQISYRKAVYGYIFGGKSGVFCLKG